MAEAGPRQSWTFGIMCYNEVGSLEAVVADIRLTAPLFASDYEILIVDDGSTDGSRELALSLEARFTEVRCLFHPVNMGIGHTLRSIYLNAAMENVANLPGDGQFKSEEYLKVRFLPAGAFVAFFRKENTHYNLFRNGLSLLNSWVNRYFIGFVCKDVNWTKVYRSADLVGLQLHLVSSLVESEICAKLRLLGRQIIEVESAYHLRLHGQAKGARAGVIFAAAKEVLRLKLEMLRFKATLRNTKKDTHAH